MPRPHDVDLSPHSEEDEAAIQRGIAADPDAPELTDVQLAAMRPALEVVPQLVRRRGAQNAPTKVPVALRLDADVVAALRGGGSGWQTRVNAILRDAVRGMGERDTAQGQKGAGVSSAKIDARGVSSPTAGGASRAGVSKPRKAG